MRVRLNDKSQCRGAGSPLMRAGPAGMTAGSARVNGLLTGSMLTSLCVNRVSVNESESVWLLFLCHLIWLKFQGSFRSCICLGINTEDSSSYLWILLQW
jgi:hypothetical protein